MVDRWAENIARYSEPDDGTGDSVHVVNASVHVVNQRRTIEEETESATDVANPPKAKRRKRRKDPMFDALVEVCRLDPKTAGSWIGKLKKQITEAGYSPDEVEAFGVEWYRRDFPGGKNDRKPPNPTSVLKYIHWVREEPAEAEPTGDIIDPDLQARMEALAHG